MSIISLLLVFIVVGFALYLVNYYIPMQPPFKSVINVVVVILLLIWLLGLIGVFPSGSVHL